MEVDRYAEVNGWVNVKGWKEGCMDE